MNYGELLDRIEEALEGEAQLDQLARKNEDPFKILISTILSARTKDKNTREATRALFSKYKTPKEIANANLEELEKLVYPAGFYKVKAARIKEVSKILVEKFNGKIPNTFEDLINLPGVGAKTANCVLVYAFKIPAIPVDTHVHRIANRIFSDVKTKTPKETETVLKRKIPKQYWIRINRLFVRFGQQICLSINPKHNGCPIEDICAKDFSMEEEQKKTKNKKKKNKLS
ncbi:MAG: endonuclease III domain-containing protein [Promethearchaeota archaeon]